MTKPVMILVAIAAIAAVWIFRYDVSPLQDRPGAVRLDRWTGTVVLCPSSEC
ncbi:hypothetical protein [Salipiger sp.]|uniref:hypothetical protein n=1 Tax=Salipiger sp. TaxID=2078585 RepID=UPI003A986875